MKKKIIWSVIGVLLLLLTGYLYQTVPSEDEIHTVSMIDNTGKEIGTIQLSETRSGVLLNINVEGLTPEGEHAIHIHEHADCTPLVSFKNAGGHFNPTEKHHGFKHEQGHHAGDMPNLMPNAKGIIQARIMNLKITLGQGRTSAGRANILDEDGSAIVIHAAADDHISQPSGAAGKRITCGIVQSDLL